jgi:four helix bundle protein
MHFRHDFDAWAVAVPAGITRDPIWRATAYRYAAFMSQAVREDARRLRRDWCSRPTIGQLLRSVGSVSANLAEGYGRLSGRDRAHFYEYAYGSAREARDWYFQNRFVLGEEIMSDRLDCLWQTIRLLAVMIPRERGRTIAPAADG